jgi:hypothetical protein
MAAVADIDLHFPCPAQTPKMLAFARPENFPGAIS